MGAEGRTPKGCPPMSADTRTSPRRRWAKISEAADHLQVTPRTIRHMIADGRITGYRSGTRLVRVDLNELDAAMVAFGGAV